MNDVDGDLLFEISQSSTDDAEGLLSPALKGSEKMSKDSYRLLSLGLKELRKEHEASENDT